MKKKITTFLIALVLLIPCIAYAASGYARYYLVANDVSSAGMQQVNSVQQSMKYLGYTTTYSYLPGVAGLCSGIQNAVTWVVHGHGNPGEVVCKQSDGTEDRLYADVAVSGDDRSIIDFADGALSSTEYGLYVTCYSGRESDYGESIVHMTFVKGANTVTGFYNPVAGGEWWAADLYVNLDAGYTIATAIANANFAHNQQFEFFWDSPANHENRLTLGNTDKTL